ncbi:hypothetical protein DEO72_LG8g3037 [Vigna unguiculata]|uniref:Uncharacterized protein n=1 Tax=Vigna unguiculata TaxID=3917 RepID=A0A4D6MYN2_VIGUN|nr:hypothetical protein DEO72_LG8g3037 [Vigna unguiculata]
MLKNPKTASEISPNDPIGVIFGKEHPGQVRGLSYGACSTLAFQQPTTRIRGIKFASHNAASPHDEDKFVKIENELATIKNQEHVAAMATGLVCPSINESPNIGSGVPSSHEILGSSGGSKTP